MSDVDDDSKERSPLDDPELREELLVQARECADHNRANLSFLARQRERLDVVLAKDVHESVRRAAGQVSSDLAHHMRRQNWLARGLAQGISAIEGVSSVWDAVNEGSALIEFMKSQRRDDLSTSDASAVELAASVDAVEFAAAADHSEELRKASGAMERILGGVTELRQMGFSIGDVQAMVDDFITQKTKHELRRDFSLLAPVISGTDSKGTKRNKRMVAKQREQLLEQDEWVLRFLNEFWCRYWRNAFERSVPEERETNIECAGDLIPDILDGEKEPLGLDSLLSRVWGGIKDRRREGESKLSRIRLQDEHVLVALDRLVQSGGANASAVVKIAGEAATYWTRHRAETAGLEIAPCRLRLVPPEDR